jgi:3alpha(or 20beta)-hydroxysteroid dehydrogenase
MQAVGAGAVQGRGRLQGKVAVVTGAARGQGAAIAALFAAEGAAVVVGDILVDELSETAASIGEAAVPFELDVRNEDSWSAVMEMCGDRFGGIDVLVNNAGIVRVGTVETTTLDDYRSVIEVNQIGCFLGMRAAIPAMRRRGGGSIVNTSSVAGLEGTAGVIGYSASKFAIRGMTRSAALELGGDGIRVNAIHPGAIDTPMINGPEFASVDRVAFAAGLPLRRIGVPQDVAWLALFLASDESAYCTGAEFVVDGGSSCGARR